MAIYFIIVTCNDSISYIGLNFHLIIMSIDKHIFFVSPHFYHTVMIRNNYWIIIWLMICMVCWGGRLEKLLRVRDSIHARKEEHAIRVHCLKLIKFMLKIICENKKV